MLPTNMVSFMKKMVKNPDTGPDNAAKKLTRLKQTLTSAIDNGIQQAQDSVAKFSPKTIHVGVDMSRRLHTKDSPNSDDWSATAGAASGAAKVETQQLEVTPPLLNVVGGNKSCSGPPDRSTSCRVCVRSLSGSSDVSYRLCSQCNLKVCEDCASYSNLDNDIDQTFWRCSVCRRKGQDSNRGTPSGTATPTPTTLSTTSRLAGRQPPLRLNHRWSDEKPLSVSPSELRKKNVDRKAASPATLMASTPNDRRITASDNDIKKSTTKIQPPPPRSLHHGVHSFEDVRIAVDSSRLKLDQPEQRRASHCGQHEGSVLASATLSASVTASISASESSPEEGDRHQRGHQRQPGNACRRSFQQQPRDQSLFLSADDAVNGSRWNQRRYSSESSDASDTSCRDGDAATTATSPAALVPSTRRRISFRTNRSSHFYDADGSDGYDADEQSVGTFDSSPSPVSPGETLATLDGHCVSPRRSYAEIPDRDIVDIGSHSKPIGCRSPRGSIYDVSDDSHVDKRQRKLSSQPSDPAVCSLSRSQSPRPSVSPRQSDAFCSSEPRSVEAIRIIIDDVDSSDVKKAAPVATTTRHVVRLQRDPSKSGQTGFSGFGLTLSAGRCDSDGHLTTVISRVEPHGIADRAGLYRGDTVLCWDGVKLAGRSFDQVHGELQHSGDSIKIQVERHMNGSHITNRTPTLLLDSAVSGRATPPSPSRRRLPQAPVVSKQNSLTESGQYRVSVKLKYNMNERGKNGCLVIHVQAAERPQQSDSDEDSLVWVHVTLNFPDGNVRQFMTDRLDAMYYLRWNTVFSLPDLSSEDATRCYMTLSLWQDSFQRDETKLAESSFDLERVALDGRSVWFALRQILTTPSTPILITPRMLYKALSHEQNSVETDVETYCHMDAPNPIPRSRSAECNLLQTEADWTSGLSAPASLAPSRRGSDHLGQHVEGYFKSEQHGKSLGCPQSTPTSRRGSFTFDDTNQLGTPDLAAIQQKLSSASQDRRGHSMIRHRDLSPGQAHDRIHRSSYELGAGQILPAGYADRKSQICSAGQIKLGLIISKGQLEVEIIAARNLSLDENNTSPDTFVKVMLTDEERVYGKRKTKTMRQSTHPQFHQTLLFEACNALGATLIVTLRLKNDCRSLRKALRGGGNDVDERSLGVVHIALDLLPLVTLSIGWYRLIPCHSINISQDLVSDESP